VRSSPIGLRERCTFVVPPAALSTRAGATNAGRVLRDYDFTQSRKVYAKALSLTCFFAALRNLCGFA
jgi:hypothetical protein